MVVMVAEVSVRRPPLAGQDLHQPQMSYQVQDLPEVLEHRPWALQQFGAASMAMEAAASSVPSVLVLEASPMLLGVPALPGASLPPEEVPVVVVPEVHAEQA